MAHWPLGDVDAILAAVKTPAKVQRRLLKIREVMGILSCSQRTVYNYIEQGLISTVRIGRHTIRIPSEEVDALLNGKGAATNCFHINSDGEK